MDVVGVSEMAGADAANGGRLLIEVTDEGEAADLSSDRIESFEDSPSCSSLPTLFSEDLSDPLVTDPPVDFADAMDESDAPPLPPGCVLSSFSRPSFCSSCSSL